MATQASTRPVSVQGVTALCSELAGPGDVRFHSETFDAVPAADELLCETLYTAISPGTELAAFQGLEPLRPTASPYPRLVGYLNVARVMTVGPALTGLYEPGQLIASFTSHRSHFTVKEERIAGLIPESLDPRRATLAYLYRLALSGLRRGRMAPGKKVAVIGLGPIGLAAVRLAVLGGCDVTALSNAAASRAVAEAFGSGARPKSKLAVEEITAQGDGRVDLVLTTSNAWPDWELALELAGFNAVISVIGFPGRGQTAPDFNPLASAHFYDRQLALVGSGTAPETIGSGHEPNGQLRADMAWLFERMAAGDLKEEHLIAAEMKGTDLEDAYRFLMSENRAPGTVVLSWS